MVTNICFDLFNAYQPHYKCGAEVAAAAVAAAAAIGGSIMSSEASSSNVDKQIGAQQDENDKNRAFNANQAELGRAFTNQQRIAQQDFAKGIMQAQQLYDSQQWKLRNSPQSQVNNVRAAGLNPAVYFSNSSMQSGSSNPGTAPNISGASSPVASLMSSISPVSYQGPQIPQMVSSVSNLANALANAKKSGAETKNLEKQYDLILEQITGEQYMNKRKAFENELMKVKAPKEIRKLQAEIDNLYAQKSLAYYQGKNFEQDTQLKKAQEEMTEELSKLHHENAAYLHQQAIDLFQTLDARIDAIKASAARDFASAEESRASAESIKYNTSMQKAMEAGKLSMFLDEVDTAFSNSVITRAQADYYKASAELQRTAANHAEAEYWKQFVLSLLGGAVDVANTAVNWRNSKAFLNLSNSSQRNVEVKMEELQKKYGPVHEIYNYNAQGHLREKEIKHD